MSLDTARILTETLEQGGGTFTLTGSDIPATGYVVAMGRKYGAILSDNDPQKFHEMLTEIAGIGFAKNIGTWHNGDSIYIDLVEIVQDESEAYRLGVKRNQISIWDIANADEIMTGGNGE